MTANTIAIYWQCSSCEDWQIEIKGSTGTYTVTFDSFSHKNKHRVRYDYSCTCKGYKFRGTCKHIEKAKEQHCCWQQFIDGDNPKANETCPKCGEPAVARRHRI